MRTRHHARPASRSGTCRVAALVALAALGLFATTAMTGCDGGRGTAARRAAPAETSPAAELGAGQKAYAAGDRIGALRHFLAAAEGGNADAQYYAGVMYADGQGVERDYAEAAKWYEKAAAQNQPDALVALARLRVLGLGVDADPAKAVELYARAVQAYPPGEQRDQAQEQHKALLELLQQQTEK